MYIHLQDKVWKQRKALPDNKENGGNDPHDILTRRVLGLEAQATWEMTAFLPTKLGTDQKYKSQE